LLAAGLALLSGTAVRAADGDFLWKWKNGDSSERAAVYSSPAADANGTIYYGVEYDTQLNAGAVVALNTRVVGTGTGKAEKWYSRMPDWVESGPVIGSDVLYVGCWDGKLYSLYLDSGLVKQSYDTTPVGSNDAWAITSSPALSRDGNTVYFGASNANPLTYPSGPGAVYALTKDLTFLWKLDVGGAVDAAPAIGADGTIYIGARDKIFYAINPDKSIKWKRPLDDIITASAAIGGDGVVYVGSYSQFMALNPKDGSIKWQVPISTPGSPVIGPDGTIYVGNFFDGQLYALDPTDGKTLWKQLGPPSLGSTPIVRADNIVIFGGNDGVLRAYNPDDKDDNGVKGKIIWTSSTKVTGVIGSGPVIVPTADHSILVGAKDGAMYSFAGNDYGVSRYAAWPMVQHDIRHTSQAPDATVDARLINLTARGVVGPGHALIGGFAVKGTGRKQVLVRAIGPTLQSFGVPNPLPDPKVTVHFGDVFTYPNDNWSEGVDAGEIEKVSPIVGAFPLPVLSKDSALLFEPSSFLSFKVDFTQVVESVDGRSGIALFELYDSNQANIDCRLVNLSSRAQVGTGDNILIAGLFVAGSGKQRVLVRAVGPGLTQYGVTGVLQRPVITLFNADGVQLASNTGWTTDGWKGDLVVASRIAGAFPLTDNSTDSAMILTLSQGAYTFLVTGVGGTTGEALVEVYALPY
jgi:outer membrane protein assembly factor BamB